MDQDGDLAGPEAVRLGRVVIVERVDSLKLEEVITRPEGPELARATLARADGATTAANASVDKAPATSLRIDSLLGE